MIQRTCGNLDGKPCEFWYSLCPKISGIPTERTHKTRDACAPMVALVECRAERDRLNAVCAAEEAVRETLTDEVERLRPIEAAAKAHRGFDARTPEQIMECPSWDDGSEVAIMILAALGPDGKPVEVKP